MEWFTSNIELIIAAIGGSTIGMFILFKAITYGLKFIRPRVLKYITDNDEKFAEEIDEAADKLQKKNPEAGKEYRKTMIELMESLKGFCDAVIASLKKADGVN